MVLKSPPGLGEGGSIIACQEQPERQEPALRGMMSIRWGAGNIFKKKEALARVSRYGKFDEGTKLTIADRTSFKASRNEDRYVNFKMARK